MEKSDILERIKKVVADQLGKDQTEILPDSSFVDDLQVDSLDMVELVMALEEEFSKEGRKIEISDEEAEKLTTIQAVVAYIDQKLKEPAEP